MNLATRRTKRNRLRDVVMTSVTTAADACARAESACAVDWGKYGNLASDSRGGMVSKVKRKVTVMERWRREKSVTGKDEITTMLTSRELFIIVYKILPGKRGPPCKSQYNCCRYTSLYQGGRRRLPGRLRYIISFITVFSLASAHPNVVH